MNKEINKNLLAKLFAGTATDEEIQLLYDSPEFEKMLRNEWENTEKGKTFHGPFDREKLKAGIVEKLNKKHPRIISFSPRRLIKYAAILFIPVLFAFLAYYFLYSPVKHEFAQIVEKQNQKGIRTEFVLPDGSKVWLNAESKISYPEFFNGRNRFVRLEGEAYFEVQRDPKKPFIVKTNQLDIEVLGTRFNVRSYAGEKYIETTLLSGKLSVNLINPETGKVSNAILHPNQQATFEVEEQKFRFSEVEADRFIAWTQGKLVIESESLIEMARSLERWYDVEIDVSPEIAEKHTFTLTIGTEKLEEVLSLIEKTTPGLKISYQDKKVRMSE
jgi:transmembrane sensor